MDRRGEITWQGKDDTVFPARATITKVARVESSVMAVFLRDITEKKEAAKQIDQARGDLAHIGRVNTLGEISAFTGS